MRNCPLAGHVLDQFGRLLDLVDDSDEAGYVLDQLGRLLDLVDDSHVVHHNFEPLGRPNRQPPVTQRRHCVTGVN